MLINIPDEIYYYYKCENSMDELKKNAFLLYPYIKNGTISHGKVAEILGIQKMELINLYGDEGLPYLDDMTIDELQQDVNSAKTILSRTEEKSC